MIRWEVRWFRFDAPDKRRPVLLLGPTEELDGLSQIPVIPLSTQSRDLPWEVRLTPEDGVPSLSYLKPEWIRSVERSQLGPRISRVPESRWPEISRAVAMALGLQEFVNAK
jgi:mRNA interferase MazF